MKKHLIPFLSLFIFLTACSRVPITGRKTLNLIPESTMRSMAVSQYQSFLSQNKVVSASGNSDAEMVKRVGSRIAAAVTRYLDQHNMSDRIADYKWEFNLVQDKQANAWCMPGGKVVVYTGLFPYTQSETALAIVMGHEIAHAIARHGNERMSESLIAQGLQVAGAVALDNNPKTQNLFLQSYGIGSQLGLLAFSRQDESEADHLGLIFAAMAGYDPRVAIPFWERMQKAGSGQAPPELLSDHPSDQRRINDLKKLMPEALKYYNPQQNS